MVVFSSFSGLGNQSRRLAQMLKPERILLIDSSPFSINKEQHPKWYEGFTGFASKGFPTNKAVNIFLNTLTHLYIIENPLNWNLIVEAKRRRIKTYIASNYEFCDNLNHQHYPLPDYFLMPSHWMINDMRKRFGRDRVKYLPPPIFPNEFLEAREKNLKRNEAKKRFVHVVGTLAAADRNGTLLLLEALKHTKQDFELVITSQHQLPTEYISEDKRVSYVLGSKQEAHELYTDFDAMILPRRFGGLCLPMCEALMSALPVIMPDISPNNSIMPSDWLVPAEKDGYIMTRTRIDLFSVDVYKLAEKIDEFAVSDLTKAKIDAFELAHKEYSQSSLEEEYKNIW